jgi:hypothetical protein
MHNCRFVAERPEEIMVDASHPERGRYRALASAALLLALCLIVGGTQAVTEPMDMAALFTSEGGIDRGAAADTAVMAVTDSPIATSNAADDGEPFQVLSDPAHVWVAGDVFSLHGVDRYRYVVVYTRDTADSQVHGCYEVDRTDSGRYVVSQYVHGQEVFGDAFIAEQGGRFQENVPLDQVAITDDTPIDGGRTYFGMTLGSIFGAANAPLPTETPEPVPTALLRPNPAPTAAPTWAVSVTRTPGPVATLSSNASPIPMPTVSPTTAQPFGTELPLVKTTEVPVLAPTLEPTAAIRAATVTPAVTTTSASPSFAYGKRYAVGNPGSFLGTAFSSSGTSTGTSSPRAAITPAETDTPGSRAFGITPPTGQFVRWYPAARWQAGIT